MILIVSGFFFLKSNKISKDSIIGQEDGFDLDYLDWIIDKGWLRIKK